MRSAHVACGGLTRRVCMPLGGLLAAVRSGRPQLSFRLIAVNREPGPDFVRLANALSRCILRSEERRLLDAMLLAGPR
jgi:hypothetical protein